MLYSILAFTLFGATTILASPAPPVASPLSATKCNHDNCYNAMTNAPAVASQLCSTFVQSTTVVTVTPTITVSGFSTITPTSSTASITTGPTIPSHISQQCVLTTNVPLAQRISSVCSCLSVTGTLTATSTYTAPATTTTIPPSCTDFPSTTLTVDDATVNLQCNYGYGYATVGPSFGGLADFQDCITHCVDNGACVGADFHPYWAGQTNVCQLYNAGSNIEYLGRSQFFTVTRAPPQCSDLGASPFAYEGGEYDLSCGGYINANPITDNQSFAGSFEDCLQVCYATPDCVSINYAFAYYGAGNSICQTLSPGGSFFAASGFDSARDANI